MGFMTFAEMKVDVRFQMNQRTDVDPATVAGAVRLNNWINRAYRWICQPNVFRHPAMKKSDILTVSRDVVRYPLPPDLFSIRFVINETKNDEYSPIVTQRLLDTTGRERRWTRDGNSILFRITEATDGDTIRIYYWARPKKLTADAHRTEIDEYFDEVLVHRATGQGCAGVGELARAEHFNAMAAQLINDIKGSETFEAENERWENDLRSRDSYQRD